MNARLMNWDRRLVEWAEVVSGRAFVWGEIDCWMLVRGAVEAMYGPLWLASVSIPTYRTKSGAVRAWEQTGGTGAVLKAAGAAELPDGDRRRGDVLLVKLDPFDSAFVIVGREMLGVFQDDVVRRWPASAVPLDGPARLLRLP